MIKALVRHPYAKVEFATETGELTIFQKTKTTDDNMDINILSIETKRDIGNDDCATFLITLVFKEDWYYRIGGNDLVVIRLGDGYKEKPIFYGLVDSIYESESYPELVPTRSIVINGRGFNKALIQFGIGAISDLETYQYTAGFFPKQFDVMAKGTPAKVTKTAYEYYLNNGIDINFANGESFRSLSRSIFKDSPGEPESTMGDEQLYTRYEGGLWEYLKELRNAPFNEMFWEVINDKPTLVMRPTPFNPDEWNQLPETELDSFDIITKNLGRSDLETYTCFVVRGETIPSSLDLIFGRPLWYPPFYGKYGLRSLQVNSKYNYLGAVPGIDASGNVVSGGGTPITSSEPSISESKSVETRDLGGAFSYPLSNARLTSKYGRRKDPVSGKAGTMHNGIDLAAPLGTPIPAVGDGVVRDIGYNKISGHWIEIQHSNGLVTRYQHCNTKPTPLKGDSIKRGQVIAEVGKTGKATGPHLHFEVKKNGKSVDPMPYIQGSSSTGKGDKGDGIEKNTISKVDMSKVLPGLDFNASYEKAKQNIKDYGGAISKEGNDRLRKNYGEHIYEDLFKDETTRILENKNFFDFAMEESKTEQKEREDNLEKEFSPYVGGGSGSGAVISQKTVNLFNWNIHNNEMENGTIKVIGKVDYKIGTRLYVKETDMEYYIENVSHLFTYNESWTTSLQVTRGMEKGTRFNSPWNEYQVMTETDMMSISGASIGSGPGQPIEESSGQVNSDKAKGNINNLSTSRQNLVNTVLSKSGEIYSQSKRMKDGYSDCSSFVYKRSCEALGVNYKGSWAPNTSSMSTCELYEEIPMNSALPGDILWRPGHTEFVSDEGMNGRSFGAHKPGTPAGYGGKISSGNWRKAYRVKGVK